LEKKTLDEIRMISITRLFLILSSLLLSAHQVNALTMTAEETVQESTQEVLDRLQTDRDKLESNPKYIQVIVEELIVPHFDFATMSHLVLGKHWHEISESRQICFIHGFKNLLVRRYADIFLGYDDKIIAYQPTEPAEEEDVVIVKQTITRPGEEPFFIEYPVRSGENGWKVIDLVVEGISLLKSYHGTFQSEINKQGLQTFIDSFQECNDQSIKYDSQSMVIDTELDFL
jgi:phospholipid transport system substrate-binding protein